MDVFCFGYGYVAQHLAPLVPNRISGTRRLIADDNTLYAWHGQADLSAAGLQALRQATHILISVPPDADGCPVARRIDTLLPDAPSVQSILYLSTTGVYGDTHGQWVDENAALQPTSERAAQRIAAERQWQDWGGAHDVPVQIHRLSGIYGPGRSPFDRIARGDGAIIDAPGHVFNRVHVSDIARILYAGMQVNADAVYNVSDDVPAAQGDVMRYAYALLEREPPAPVALADAGLSPMAQDFYRDCKRVCNEKIKNDLGIVLRYPGYVEGLSALYNARDTQPPS